MYSNFITVYFIIYLDEILKPKGSYVRFIHVFVETIRRQFKIILTKWDEIHKNYVQKYFYVSLHQKTNDENKVCDLHKIFRYVVRIRINVKK